jgi:predicted ATP-binding protein involved in virulence
MDISDMPNFHVDSLPKIKIKSIAFKNFKVFDDCNFDFTNNNQIKNFVCFIGNNGCGKSTVLNSIGLIFSNLNLSEDRLTYNLGKAVRHEKYIDHTLTNDDFLITAKLELEEEGYEYEVQINREGFLKDHPSQIKELVSRICYATRFDQELRNFQLTRGKWKIFKRLFESVTGFKIKEQTSMFSEDGINQESTMDKYVLGFLVKKPRETILHRECSDGEKKIIKSFSTLLNLEYLPQIILIDNVEMHVESGRHLPLIKEMKSCFPDSQIFTTTHSYQISRNFSERSQVYDLRTIHAIPIIKAEPWRLCLIDEITDCLVKLEYYGKEFQKCIDEGRSLIKQCSKKIEDKDEFRNSVAKWMSGFNLININNLIYK